jgi:molybdopterin molybdotransferase
MRRGLAKRLRETVVVNVAPLPSGADAVVIQEHTRRERERVIIERLPLAGENVRRRGSDLARGAVALRRGQAIGPGEIGLLAAQGVSAVAVFRRPRVAIVTTGDELRDLGEPPRPGSIINSNAYALAAQVEQAGAVPWLLPNARDDLAELVARFEDGLRADVLLSVGGVSVGEYDLVGEALERAGVQRRLWKVAIKPGKPLLFGTAGRVPVIGLPGNPVSAMVTFEVFVRPGLRRMQGHAAPYPAVHKVELAHDHRHATGRTELARASLRPGDEHPRAVLHSLQGSGSLPSMCGVDALVVIDAAVESFPRGTIVPCLLLAAYGYGPVPALG